MQINVGRNNQQLLQTSETCNLADWSFFLGIASFLFNVITAIPAVICGHLALGRIRRSGGALGGRDAAIFGLVIGYLMIASLPVALIFLNAIMSNAHESVSAGHAREIVLGCHEYARRHDGRYPPDLATLTKEGIITDETVFHCPLLHDDMQIGYRYFAAGLKVTDPPDKIVVISIAASTRSKRIVCHNDSSVEIIATPVLPMPR